MKYEEVAIPCVGTYDTAQPGGGRGGGRGCAGHLDAIPVAVHVDWKCGRLIGGGLERSRTGRLGHRRRTAGARRESERGHGAAAAPGPRLQRFLHLRGRTLLL